MPISPHDERTQVDIPCRSQGTPAAYRAHGRCSNPANPSTVIRGRDGACTQENANAPTRYLTDIQTQAKRRRCPTERKPGLRILKSVRSSWTPKSTHNTNSRDRETSLIIIYYYHTEKYSVADSHEHEARSKGVAWLDAASSRLTLS